jgi:gliding motility-associated lipoprotein GldH
MHRESKKKQKTIKANIIRIKEAKIVQCLKILFGILIVLNFSSCNTGEIYDKTYTISSDIWVYDEILDFEFTVSDTSRSYDLYLLIRNSGAYHYSNIWLFVKTFAPGGNVLTDTIEIALSDEKGRWFGKGIGDVNEMQVPYKENVYFINRGIYKVSLQHAMRDSMLEGIMDIGFKLQYHQ